MRLGEVFKDYRQTPLGDFCSASKNCFFLDSQLEICIFKKAEDEYEFQAYFLGHLVGCEPVNLDVNPRIEDVWPDCFTFLPPEALGYRETKYPSVENFNRTTGASLSFPGNPKVLVVSPNGGDFELYAVYTDGCYPISKDNLPDPAKAFLRKSFSKEQDSKEPAEEEELEAFA